ncbi:uncharacterized protein LOC119722674 isoform X2 [Patiria miniata]|uniref:Band 7 domain-containing protein n=1 Tax=Patiria miniata TaxID=46514 RepID=A0A913ZB97_PATMI|nr:uncharacterized protein LOC119722674 isoform X2 [Patiria miniata]
MDFRRRGVKYQLSRISEEDEEEEEVNEETALMDEQDGDAFQEEDAQGSGENMSQTQSDPVTNGTADDTPTPPHSDSETEPEGGPVDEPETGPDAATDGRGDDNTQADGGDNEDKVDKGVAVSLPPEYQDPPSYRETLRLSGIEDEDVVRDPDEDKVRDQDEDIVRDQDEDIVRDQEDSVEPHVVVNPFDEPRDGAQWEDIEMGEMTGSKDDSPQSAEAAAEITSSSDSIKRYVQPMEIESQTLEKSFWSDRFHVGFKDTNSRSLLIMVFSVLVVVFAVLIVVLLPLTFSYVEYFELGLKRQRSTGRVLASDGAYESGRHAIGPDYTFKIYPSWATNIQLDDISVTTTSGLSHSFSCSFQYFIREGELGLLEQRFDKSYPDVIEFVAQAALKNVAATISLSMYLEQRRRVEIMFHDALRAKLGGDCCPDQELCLRYDTCHLCSNSTTNCTQGYHVDVPYFQLLEIDLPDVILDRNLQVQLLNEQAEEETFLQLELLARKKTEKETQEILNSASEVTNNGTATASLIRSLGEAEARAIVEAANSQGLALMYDRMGVTTDEHKASLHWLRTLEQQEMLVMGVSFQEYLSLVRDSIVT